MRFGSGGLAWVALAIVLAASCGYDFGGGAGGASTSSGGAGNTSSSSTGGPPDGSATTATTDASSATASTQDVSSSMSADSSSSTGTGVENPCHYTDNGAVFADPFDAGSSPDWIDATSPGAMGAIADHVGGKVNLKLGTASYVTVQSVRTFALDECSVAVSNKMSGRVDQLRIFPFAAAASSLLVFSSGGQPWFVQPPGQVPIATLMPRKKWLRVRAEGSSLFFESSDDGVTYADTYTLPRPAALTGDLKLEFGLFPNGSGDDTAEWDNLNTPP